MRRVGAAGAWAGWLVLGCTPPPAAPTGGSSSDTGGPTTSEATGPATPPGQSTTAATTDPGDSTDTSGGATTIDSTESADTSSTSGTSGSTGGDDGLGMLEGECGLIDGRELQSPSAFTFENSIDFGRLGFDYDQLTPGGQAVFDAGNLGGSSLHSEVIAFEVLARCEGATLLATEGEIQYVDPMGTKTDLRVEIDGLPVGVSVTRAVGFPPEDPYTTTQAHDLLMGKLDDVVASSANVAPRDAWVKQILHVVAYADMHAQSIVEAYGGLPPMTTADTILLVTVTHGNDAFIY